MTESSFRFAIDLINEIITFIWLTIALSIALIVLVGQKIEAVTMPTFRSLNFGQKPREEIAETEEINNGLLNRKIVVEKVKNVFGKTLKSKDKTDDEDFDIKKVIKLFQSNSNKKCVTFADKDEVITVGNDILTEFETSTSFIDDDAIDDKNENEVEDEEVKNLLFHEVDENFNPDEVKSPANYTNLGFWKNGTIPSDLITITIGKESPKPPSEPPPLPPRLCQKFNPKLRPTIPPPLPPKTVIEVDPPLVRRDLKKAKSEGGSQNMTVTELVENFIKLQEIVLANGPENKSDPVEITSKPSETEIIEGKHDNNVFNFDGYKPVDLPCATVDEVDCPKNPIPTFSTFKPDPVKQPDWKEAFFQPVNKTIVEPKPKVSKIPVLEHSKPKMIKPKIVHTKSSKIPKLVEEIMGKSNEKKRESYNAATIKKCNVKVSEIVNSFEQIQKEKGKNVKVTSVEDLRTGDFVKKCHEPVSDGNQIVGRKLDTGFVVNSSDGVSQGNSSGSEIEPVITSLESASVESTQIAESKNEIFFRAGVLAQLESQRDEKLADLVIQLQSRCRGYVARKKLAKLKIQDLAVRCIQRNVRKLMQIREWPWWRLYVKVTSLMNVHRTEEELTARIQELETLKSKLERLETERNQLKLENDKLETKVGNFKFKKKKKKKKKYFRLVLFPVVFKNVIKKPFNKKPREEQRP